MSDGLPRLKPDPIPTIHPVPEYAAGARLKAVYEATKEGLGAPWMGVVAMAFAHYPTFYAALWTALAPLAGRARFADACAALRSEAETRAAVLRPSPLSERLRAAGYAPTELDDIRGRLEVFSAGNMPYVLMASPARSLLEGQAWDATGDPGAQTTPPRQAKPPLMEAHHADPGTRAIYEDVKSTLGLPFVNTDYRALARWPTYFEMAWPDLRRIVTSDAYPAAVDAAHHRAVALARGLPNVARLSPAALIDAARADAPISEVLDVVRLFQWLLPGLAVNVACLRAQLRET